MLEFEIVAYVNSPFELLPDARNIPTSSGFVSVSRYLWIIGCGCAFGEIERLSAGRFQGRERDICLFSKKNKKKKKKKKKKKNTERQKERKKKKKKNKKKATWLIFGLRSLQPLQF